MPKVSRQAKALDLISTQIRFGLAYAQEARTAYQAGNIEYGDLARGIAADAHSSVIRQLARLLHEPSTLTVSEQLSSLGAQIESLSSAEYVRSRSIA
jgi:hypothetical protein